MPIRGSVNRDLELVVSVELADANGELHSLPVIVDTGFSGELALPSAIIQSLGLPLNDAVTLILASGQRMSTESYDGRIDWHGRRRDIGVLATREESLLGMLLLRGSKLTATANPGGAVIIEDASLTPNTGGTG